MKAVTVKQEAYFVGTAFTVLLFLLFGALLTAGLVMMGQRNADRELQDANQQIKTFAQGYFSEIGNTLEALSRDPAVIAGAGVDEAGLRELQSTYLRFIRANRNIAELGSAYDDGTSVHVGGTGLPGADLRGQEWYEAARQVPDDVIPGLPHQVSGSERSLIGQYRALRDGEGQVVGVVFSGSDPGNLDVLLDQEAHFQSQRTYLLSPGGQVLLHPHAGRIGEIKQEVLAQMDGEGGELRYVADGREVWAYYSTIPATGWLVVTAVDREDVLAPLWTYLGLYLLVALVLSLSLGGLLGVTVERRFAAPLSRLGQRLGAIAAGRPAEEGGYSQANPEVAAIAASIEALTRDSLRQKADELRTIIESTRDGILVTGVDGKVIYANTTFKKMWGLSGEMGEGAEEKGLREAVSSLLESPDDFSATIEAYYSSLEEEKTTIYLRDGRVFDLYSRPLLQDERVVGRVWSSSDITGRVRAEERLRRLATTDALTGLWNRRKFMEEARQEIARARRYDGPLALMMLDIDHFKQVNDSFGHAAGDRTLQHLGKLIRKSVREVDVAGRLGGEEFSVLLPNTDLASASRLAQRLRQRVERAEVRVKGGCVLFTVSIGLSAISPDRPSLERLLHAADAALYQAKDQGRNRVVERDTVADTGYEPEAGQEE